MIIACNGDVFMVSAVVKTPAFVRTVANLRLGARALYVVKPDLSLSWPVPGAQ